jgi:hypothetical protein
MAIGSARIRGLFAERSGMERAGCRRQVQDRLRLDRFASVRESLPARDPEHPRPAHGCETH